jgi:predicted acyl esterase
MISHGMIYNLPTGALLLALFAAPLGAQTVLNETITMRDGIVLEATVTLPSDTLSPGGFPGVVLVHGYGGEKGDMEAIASFLVYNGYASLAYSVRGQGNSGGYSTTSGETERLDLNEVVQHFRAHTGVNPDRIGVAGQSQGGIHAWMAAAFRIPGVAAVVPTYATPHFAADLVPNNCFKQGLVGEMSLGSVRYAPERDLLRGHIISDEYDSALTYIRARDLERLVDSIQIPVFQGLGWKDAFFPVNAGIRAAASLASRGIPIWSYYGANGHNEPFNFNEFVFVLTRSLDWFDRWLKDKAVDQAELPLVHYLDDRPSWPHHLTSVWPPEPAGILRLYMNSSSLAPWIPGTDDTLHFSVRYDSSYSPATGWDDRYSGSQFRSAFSGEPVRLLSAPLLDTADVTGIPRVHLVTDSDAHRYQAHIRIFDVFQADTELVWQLMTRGTNGIRGYPPHTLCDSYYECAALSHRIPPGHMIGVEVTSLDLDAAGDAHILPFFLTTHSRLFSSVSNPSYIDLPLVGSASLAGVHEPSVSPPEGFILHQNYPNPFNPVTSIRYQVPGVTSVRIAVYDLLGREVSVLLDGRQDAGSYTAEFDGSGLASGVYLYRLQAGDFVQTRRMVLLR